MSAAAEVEAPPPAERKVMGDKFRNSIADAMPDNTKPVQRAIAAAPPKPAEKPPEKPASQPKPETPAPAPAPAPQPAEQPNGELKGKAREAFDKLEKAYQQQKSDSEKFKAELDKLQPQFGSITAERDVARAELETLRKGTEQYKAVEARAKELEDVVQRFALEQDPRFQAHYNQKIQLGKDIAKGTLAGDAAVKLDQILNMPPSRIRDEQMMALGAELDDFSRARLASAYVQIESIEREKHAELSRSAENLSKAREAALRQQQMEQAAREQQQKTFVDTLYQRIDPELQDVQDAPAFKEQMRQLATNTLDHNGFLEVAGYAAKGRKYDSTVTALKEENTKLQAQVQELTAAQPSPNGTGGSAPVRKDNSEPTAQNMGREVGAKFKEAMNKLK